MAENKKLDFQKLLVASSFIQINFATQAFQVLDRAGALLEHYLPSNVSGGYNLLNQQISISKNLPSIISEIRLSPTEVWMKFRSEVSLPEVINEFIKELNFLKDTLQISKFGRVGWRTQFLYDLLEVKINVPAGVMPGPDTVILPQLSRPNLSFTNGSFKVKTLRDFDANLELQALMKSDSNNKLFPAILLDIDVFKVAEIDLSDCRDVLDSFFEYLKVDEGLVALVSPILTEIA